MSLSASPRFAPLVTRLLEAIPTRMIHRAADCLTSVHWPAPVGRVVMRAYTRAFQVDLQDCPEQSYDSFDAFFTRPLRSEARPIDAELGIVSPADGQIVSMERIRRGKSTFRVKGGLYQTEELLGDAEEAARYEGGTACVIYLSPRDYHRVHSPVAGELVHLDSMPGHYFPVNNVGVKHVRNLFARNRRVALRIDTPPETGLGRVTLVMVAALIVGRITTKGSEARDVPFGKHRVHVPLHKGEEIGMFHLGSTVILFAEESASMRQLAVEGPIQFGQPLLAPLRRQKSEQVFACTLPSEKGATTTDSPPVFPEE